MVLAQLRGIPFRYQGHLVKSALTDVAFLKPTYSVGDVDAPEARPRTNPRSQSPNVFLNGVGNADNVFWSGRRRIMSSERVRRNRDAGIHIAQRLGVVGDNLHLHNPIESNLLDMQGGAFSTKVRVGVQNSG